MMILLQVTHCIQSNSPPHDNQLVEQRTPYHVIVIDAMAILQGMRKKPSTKLFKNLYSDFLKIIDEMISPYNEARFVFDPYSDKKTLKDNTHKKRAAPGVLNSDGYDVHMEMPLKMSIKELMSASKTKRRISKILCELILQKYSVSGSPRIVAAYETTIKDNDPQSLPLIHSHDEADQLIPNQIIESAAKAPNPFANLIVFSPDTDVLTMLMNVVASGRLNATNSLKLITDKPKSKQKETIDIVERVCTIGPKNQWV